MCVYGLVKGARVQISSFGEAIGLYGYIWSYVFWPPWHTSTFSFVYWYGFGGKILHMFHMIDYLLVRIQQTAQ